MEAKTGFFKHFTLKRWMIHSACFFAFIYFCSLGATLIFDKENFYDNFEFSYILATILTSLLFGFFSCLVKIDKKSKDGKIWKNQNPS